MWRNTNQALSESKDWVKNEYSVKLCSLDGLNETDSLGIELTDQSVFVVFIEGKISVYKNHCPHLGTPLEFLPNQFLSIDKSFIQCSTHGALFEHGTGLCVSGPCSGQHLTVIPHQIRDGWIYIAV